jgi:capsular polysaccharide biosynthesis protein
MSAAPPSSDPGVEREIDLSRWRTAIVERWWIVAAGLIVGAIIGAFYSLSGGSVYQASVLIAPGQPFSPSGAPVLTYSSSPRSINEIATGEASLQQAAAAARMPINQLRGNVSTTNISTGAGSTASRGSSLIDITVKAKKGKWAADAANELGNIIKDDTTSEYVKQSIAIYQQRQKNFQTRLTSVNNTISAFETALADKSLDPIDRLNLAVQLDAAVGRQGNLQDELSGNQQSLILAQQIEVAQIIRSAAAEKTTARSRRTSIVFGALIGLLVGLIVAIVVDTRATRPRRA